MTASALIISEDINPVTHASPFEIPGNINFDNAGVDVTRFGITYILYSRMNLI